jgi:hypothetical protein
MGSALIRRSTGLVVNQPLRLQERARAGVIVSPAFNPRFVPNCELWLDADDASTLTDAGSGACSAWNDKSGNARNFAQSNSTYRPIITANTSPSGRTALVFDGSNDHLTLSEFSINDHTTIVVFKNTSGGDAVLVGSNPTNSQIRENRTGNGAYSMYDSSGPGDYVYSGATSDVLTSPHITAWVKNGTTWAEFYREFGLRERYTGGSMATNQRVGQISSLLGTGVPSLMLNGWIGEILIYSRVLAYHEFAYLMRGLGNKWGIPVAY